MRNKRGISDVITNLLIVLLVLVAVGVVWVVIKNILDRSAGEIEFGQFTLDLRIESAYINDSDIVVSVRRNSGAGADFLGTSFIFTNDTESVIIKKLILLQEGGLKTFIFSLSTLPGIGAGDEVSVAPIYSSSGQEKTGSVTDTEIISEISPGGESGGSESVCGNNVVEAGETCDDGNQGSGDGCSASCQIETPLSCDNDNQIDSGEFCDGTNLNGQTCVSLGFDSGTLLCNNCGFDASQCTFTQEGPVCGNNIVEAGEQCDGTNLNGQSCTSLGFSGAPLTCNPAGASDECRFNTSQCSPPIEFCGDGFCNPSTEDPLSCPVDCPVPESCNSLWEGDSEHPSVECDGNPLPNGCTAICTCDDGFTNSSSGTCDLNPSLNTGTILSVWNSIYFDSNDLPKNDSVNAYQNSYVNFTGLEPGCFLITLADYVPDSDRSYIRVSDVFGAPEISSGNGYSVWEAENCGQ